MIRSESLITIHAMVFGKVQRVFFRGNTRDKAISLAIKGWVRNNSDGSVELEATGEEKNINQLIEWLQHGPIMARVDKVEVDRRELRLTPYPARLCNGEILF